MIDESKQNAAKLLGVLYLSTFVIVVCANFGIYDPLHVSGNVSETAKRIDANKHLFRVGIVLDLVYALGFSTLIASLYFILKDINQRLALVATFWALIYIFTWVALTLKFFDALRLASGAPYLDVVRKEELHALARLFLSARFDRYYGVLVFYALGSLVFNYLWHKSGYIPGWLAMWGILSCAWCAICAIIYMIYPDYNKIVNLWLFDMPMALFDMALSGWLIARGLKN